VNHPIVEPLTVLLGRMWKEIVVAHFEISRYLAEGTEENKEILQPLDGIRAKI
jgi:hypothetical protein